MAPCCDSTSSCWHRRISQSLESSLSGLHFLVWNGQVGRALLNFVGMYADDVMMIDDDCALEMCFFDLLHTARLSKLRSGLSKLLK